MKTESYNDFILRKMQEERESLAEPISKLLHRLKIHSHKTADIGMHTTAMVIEEAIHTIEILNKKAK